LQGGIGIILNKWRNFGFLLFLIGLSIHVLILYHVSKIL